MPFGCTKAVENKRNSSIDKNIQELKDKIISEDFYFLVIDDPDREKTEVEVFFKPE